MNFDLGQIDKLLLHKLKYFISQNINQSDLAKKIVIKRHHEKQN